MTLAALNLPQLPLMIPTTPQQTFDEFVRIYNALHRLNNTEISTGTAEAENFQTPYYVAANEVFVVPLYKQALFATTIVNDGLLDVEGFLIEVD